MNVFWGVLIAILLQFASYTGFGQEMLNKTYDILVKEDFTRSLIIKGNKNKSVSNKIRLIVFDKNTYENSPSFGFWTPREILGKTIKKTIELGAKVVTVNFRLDKPVPNSRENEILLSSLHEAATIAEKKESIIILPWAEKQNNVKGYTRQYYDLLKQKSDIIKEGSPVLFSNPSERMIRHFSFYEKVRINNTDDIVFSFPVLAALYGWHGRKKGDEKAKMIRNQIMLKQKGIDSGITVDSDGSMRSMRLYHQDESRECLAARYKFRIVPSEVIKKDYGGGYSLQIDISPSILFDKYYDEGKIKDKIILIGSNYTKTADVHPTPIGALPSLFLHSNALNIFLTGTQIREPKLLNYFMLALWIYLASLIFTNLSKGLATFVLAAFVPLFYSPISMFLFGKGLFMNFSLPVIIMGGRSTIAGWEEYVENLLKKKEENLLKKKEEEEI